MGATDDGSKEARAAADDALHDLGVRLGMDAYIAVITADEICEHVRWLEERALEQHPIFGAFWEAWQELPPLVRAGTAARFAEERLQSGRREATYAKNAEALGMPRRMQVQNYFVRADRVFADLFVVLANLADEEAVAAGLSKLDTGEP